MFLQIEEINKSYGYGDNLAKVLNGISLDIERGELCVLLGPSGSGKSTLLNIIGGRKRRFRFHCYRRFCNREHESKGTF